MTSSTFINLNDVGRAATKQERMDRESRHGIVIPSEAEGSRCESLTVPSRDPPTAAQDDRVGRRRRCRAAICGASTRFAVILGK